MTKSTEEPFAEKGKGRGRVGGAMAALVCLAALVGVVVSASAAPRAGRTTVVLGSTSVVPDAACPEVPCQAIGSVTGFQVNNGQTRLPFRVPRDGKIKAWTLTLAQPTNKQRAYFNDFFGTPPEARLSILRRVPRTHPPRYSLRTQSSIHVLSPYLGQMVKFSSSLRVRKGDIVALTVPTWAPAISIGLTRNNTWRASRASRHCVKATDLRQSEPQTRLHGRATYGCRYSTARLLYTATLVED